MTPPMHGPSSKKVDPTMTMKVIELVGMIFGPKTLTFFSMAQQMLRFIYLQLQGANYAQTLNPKP